jgi:hypothetical protein
MTNPHVAAQLKRLQRIRQDGKYDDRVKAQMLSWAMGKPYHEPINDECCPDFSCCMPGMFTEDAAERWAQYNEKYAN